MTTVCISDDEVLLTGHAGYGPHGADIVCEAITILCHTLEASVECGRCEKWSGHFKADRRECSHDEAVVFDAIIRGWEILAWAYPKNVRIVRKGADGKVVANS